jgi:hypothetical protein
MILTAAVFHMEDSEFPGVNWRSLPQDVEENFKQLVYKIKAKLLGSLKDTRTLGYSLKAGNLAQCLCL